MRLIDAFCGTGGWSSGAIAAGVQPVLGIDCDHTPLQLWAANCAPAGRATCATLGTDEPVEWPAAAPDIHIHLSPPCTSLSKARAGSAPAESVAAALDAVRWSVQLVLDRGYASWSLENVATPGVVACLRDLAQQNPTRVAFIVLDAADYGVPSSRVRLIASTPEAIRALKEVPVRRVSVAEAFSVAGVPLPSDWIKSNTTNRDGSPCVRSVRRHPARCPPHISSHRTLTHAAATPLRQVQQPSFTVTASHPLIWARRDGTTVRCLTVAESAVRCAPARAPPPSHSTTCGAVSLTREHAPRMPTQGRDRRRPSPWLLLRRQLRPRVCCSTSRDGCQLTLPAGSWYHCEVYSCTARYRQSMLQLCRRVSSARVILLRNKQPATCCDQRHATCDQRAASSSNVQRVESCCRGTRRQTVEHLSGLRAPVLHSTNTHAAGQVRGLQLAKAHCKEGCGSCKMAKAFKVQGPAGQQQGQDSLLDTGNVSWQAQA